jgi:hypothetical protein
LKECQCCGGRVSCCNDGFLQVGPGFKNVADQLRSYHSPQPEAKVANLLIPEKKNPEHHCWTETSESDLEKPYGVCSDSRRVRKIGIIRLKRGT